MRMEFSWGLEQIFRPAGARKQGGKGGEQWWGERGEATNPRVPQDNSHFPNDPDVFQYSGTSVAVPMGPGLNTSPGVERL